MKKTLKTLTSLTLVLILVQPLHAGKKETEAVAIAAAIAAGIAIIATTLNKNNNCEKISDYKNYTTGIEMFTVPGSQILNYKSNVCKKDIIRMTQQLNDTDEFKFIVEPGKEVSYQKLENENKRVNIAKTILSGSDLISGKKPVRLHVNIDDSGTVVGTDKMLKYLMNKKLFEKRTVIIPTENTFSQEILYGGIEGNILHLQYREFLGDYIRNPFTQNIIYDLSKGNLIRLKRFTIEIVEANNMKITYIIK